MGIILTVVVLSGFILLYIWYTYNDLVTLKMRIKDSWSQIDVQLKRRSDLIPNLVNTVKGYLKHEKTVLENVTKARTAIMHAKSPTTLAVADQQFANALKTLFAVAENYPNLKASDNFLQLQKELSDTEDKIAYARQFYNTAVLDFNTKLQTFPSAVIARNFGFTKAEFFEASDEERKKVDVKFD